MAGCFGSGDEVSEDDVREWKTNLSNVLRSTKARKFFRAYLISRTLEDDEKQLDFWEKCHPLLNNTER
jgi:hypothetical protein